MAKMVKTEGKTKEIAIIGGIGALAAVGIVLLIKAKPKATKKAGDTITAEITIVGKGYPGTFQVGFGLAPSALLGSEIKQFFVKKVPLELESDFKTFKIEVSDKLKDVFQSGKIDALVFVQTENGILTSNPFDYLKTKTYLNALEIA